MSACLNRLLFSLSGSNGTTTFDLFDSDNGQDLTLSPQTFTSSTEAFINDNSDSLGVPGDTDTGKLNLFSFFFFAEDILLL